MRYRVRHQTSYRYSDSVSISYNRLHGKPRPCPWQTSQEPQLRITPEPDRWSRRTDYFGNPLSLFTVQSPHQELQVSVAFEAEVRPRTYQEVPSEPWEATRDRLIHPGREEELEACQFRFDSTWVRSTSDLTEYARSSFARGCSVLEGARSLCGRIYREFDFDPSATNVATPVSEVFARRKGVCQDFAHLMLAALRGLGLAARYVSGYILTVPPPGQPKLQGADASHAWVSVWTSEHGWVDLDPTNDLVVSDQHITLAWGRDYHDVCPLRGVVLGGGSQTIKVAVDVEEIGDPEAVEKL